MRATFLAGGDADRARRRRRRAQHRPRARRRRSCSTSRCPSTARAACRLDLLDDGRPLQAAVNHRAQRLPRPARPDHDHDRRAQRRPRRRRRAAAGDDVRRGGRALPGQTLLLAAGDNVGASPPNSALLDDMPAIDVENAWGLDATSFGNHEFDFGVERILAPPGAGRLPVPVGEHRRGGAPASRRDWMRAVGGVQASTACRSASSAPTVQDDAGARAAPAPPRACASSTRPSGIRQRVGAAAAAGRQGAGRRHPRGRGARRQPRSTARPAAPWQGPIIDIVEALQDTTDRPRDRRPHPPHRQHRRRPHPGRRGRQRRRQLLGRPADGDGTATSSGPARRRGSPRTSASRRGADVQAIVDAGERRDRRAAQPGDRHAVDRHPARPDAAQRVGDGQPRRRRDARRSTRASTPRSPTRAACAQDILDRAAVGAARQPGEITWGEVFAVLPFGNRTVIETLTGAQLTAALLNGFCPVVQPGDRAPGASRRCPGSSSTFHCNGHDAGHRRDLARRRTGRRARSPRSGRPTRSASSPTTSCSPAATATRRSPAAPTCCSRATAC